MYFRQQSDELVSQFFDFGSFFNGLDHNLFLIKEFLDLGFGVLDVKWNTLSRFESIMRSAIILR